MIELTLLFIIVYIQKAFYVRISDEEKVVLYKWYKRILNGLTVVIFLLLVYESLFGNSFYVLVIYLILKNRLVSSAD